LVGAVTVKIFTSGWATTLPRHPWPGRCERIVWLRLGGAMLTVETGL
jgi:hypothetical protein